jgi:hypothetical protein
MARAAKAAFFAALTAFAGLGFLEAFAPEERPPHVVPFEGYDVAPMRAAMTPERVRARADKILAFGSRFLGQPGFYKTCDYVRASFEAAGLERLELPARSAAPRTLRREILSEATGRKLPGVEIFPFFPNHLQPMNTPPEGLVGTLVLVDEKVLATARTFDDSIALVDSSRPPPQFQFNWIKYAQLGFRVVQLNAVPEPSSIIALLGGLTGLFGLKRRGA